MKVWSIHLTAAGCWNNQNFIRPVWFDIVSAVIALSKTNWPLINGLEMKNITKKMFVNIIVAYNRRRSISTSYHTEIWTFLQNNFYGVNRDYTKRKNYIQTTSHLYIYNRQVAWSSPTYLKSEIYRSGGRGGPRAILARDPWWSITSRIFVFVIAQSQSIIIIPMYSHIFLVLQAQLSLFY